MSIVGKNFTGVDFLHGGDVYIGNTNGIQVNMVSDTLIQAKVAWIATDGPVAVKNAIGTAQLGGFTKLYSVGDYLNGGEVIYTDTTKRHGLIVLDRVPRDAATHMGVVRPAHGKMRTPSASRLKTAPRVGGCPASRNLLRFLPLTKAAYPALTCTQATHAIFGVPLRDQPPTQPMFY